MNAYFAQTNNSISKVRNGPSVREGILSGRWIFSLLFAAVIILGPWEAIRGDDFADLVNYRTRIYELQDYGMRYFVWENSVVGWLRYEFLWFYTLALVAYNNIHPDIFIATIAGVSAFLTHSFLSRYLGVLLATIVLLNPITIDLLSSQIRSAVAFALFLGLIHWRFPGRLDWLRIILFLPLLFIHTGLFLILGFFAGSIAIARTQLISPQQKVLATAAAAVILTLSIAYLLPSIVEVTEDRRSLSQYGLKSPAYLMYWFICAGALIVSINQDLSTRWEYFFALVICLTAPLLEIAGLPGFRFIALAIPVIFAAFAGLRGIIMHGLLFATLAYQFLLIIYWVR